VIKNLVVNGCSFTRDQTNTNTWATHLRNTIEPKIYQNLACSGAGNFYICNSTIDYLSSSNLDPAETMVIVMWSGSGRKDIRISGEWYYHFENQYNYRAKSFNDNESEYYLFSGGLTNSWMETPPIRKIFEWSYKLSDPVSLCKDTLIHIINLENYLKVHGYQYRFAGYVNQWTSAQDHSPLSGDYSIGYFLKDMPVYDQYKYDSWIFVDQERNCLGEFAKNINELDQTVHPTELAHRLFANNIILPQLIDSYAMQQEQHSQ
jgi:hypothetical protein